MSQGPPSTSMLPAVLAKVRNPIWTVAALWIVIEGLREAKSILIPIAVAVMLAIICAPAVNWLERRRIPNAAAVLLVVMGIFGMLAMLGAVVGSSVSSFQDSIPVYTQRLTDMAEGALLWLQGLGLPPELDASHLSSVIEPGQAASKILGVVPSAMGGLASALSNTFLVMFTMVFILMEKGTVPSKLRAMAGAPDADISQYRRIATEVQSYLAIKSVVSLGTGGLVGIWCAALGVDFAVLWALVAFLLNYIPTIGSIIAAVPAVLLALVQHGPGTALALLVGYIVVNTLVGNVLEPMWMGRRLGLSTTVVFLSLVIWGWIWESVGMLLSVPLTMIIKIMLENSREYRFIAALLDVGKEDEDLPSVVDVMPHSEHSPVDVVTARTPSTRPAASFSVEPPDDMTANTTLLSAGEALDTDDEPPSSITDTEPTPATPPETTEADNEPDTEEVRSSEKANGRSSEKAG